MPLAWSSIRACPLRRAKRYGLPMAPGRGGRRRPRDCSRSARRLSSLTKGCARTPLAVWPDSQLGSAVCAPTTGARDAKHQAAAYFAPSCPHSCPPQVAQPTACAPPIWVGPTRLSEPKLKVGNEPGDNNTLSTRVGAGSTLLVPIANLFGPKLFRVSVLPGNGPVAHQNGLHFWRSSNSCQLFGPLRNSFGRPATDGRATFFIWLPGRANCVAGVRSLRGQRYFWAPRDSVMISIVAIWPPPQTFPCNRLALRGLGRAPDALCAARGVAQ